MTIKYGKKIEKLMKIDFNTKTTYGDDDDKYIKTKIKTYKDSTLIFFISITTIRVLTVKSVKK